MARLITLKLGSQGSIKGDVDVASVKDEVRLGSYMFNASASITHGSQGGGDVQVGTVQVHVKYGEWVGDLQKALYSGQIFDSVTISEVDQKVEAQANADPKLVRKVVLTNAYIANMAMQWHGPTADLVMAFEFEKWDMTYEAKTGAKMASRDLMATT